jgi:hypothetical protein
MEINRRSSLSSTFQVSSLNTIVTPVAPSTVFGASALADAGVVSLVLNHARAGSPIGENNSAPLPSSNSASWGSGLRDLSQEGLKKGVDEAKKKGTWKDSGSSLNSSSSSLGNIGGQKMPDNLSNLGAWGKGTTLAEWEWHAARVGDIDYKDSGDWGSFHIKGATDFLKVQGRVYGDADFKDWTVTVGGGVQGRVEIVGSHYEAGYKTPSIFNLGGHDIDFDTEVSADASVGVNGFAEGEIGLGKNTHLNLGAGGFDGASASLAGSESVGDLASVNGGVKAWAGVGAKADVDAGFKDGKVTFHFGAGLALGVGLEYDWGFSVDFAEIGDSLYNIASDPIGFVGDVGNWVEDTAGDVADTAGDVAEAAGDAAEDAVDAVGDAAGDVVDAAGDAAGAVGDAISDVFDW